VITGICSIGLFKTIKIEVRPASHRLDQVARLIRTTFGSTRLVGPTTRSSSSMSTSANFSESTK
jgi:hypothetical protein